MTIRGDTKDILGRNGLSRDDALVAAKSIAQEIVDDSTSTDTPLVGIVYTVCGPYNDGMPSCTLTGNSSDKINFSGEFRTRSGGTVERRRTLDAETVRRLASVRTAS